MTLNIKCEKKRLSCVDGECIVVGDNDDYFLHFNMDEKKAAVFAVFRRGKKEERTMLDESGNVKIPLWCLKNGFFNVGIITSGYASTPCPIYVIGSILEDEGEPTEDPPKTQIEQLIDLVNRTIAGQSGVNIKSVYIDDGELIIELSNGNKINAGKCRGSDETQFLELFKGYGEGLSPSENTALIRSAIEFCSKAHIGTLKFPYQKVFLCEMPEGETTLFDVPSNMTIDLNGSEISLTANKLPNYKIFRMSYTSCENSVLKNGKITGNKDKIYTENGVDYDYEGVKKLTKSTCEWGTAVGIGGKNNRIENLEISQCRGDGVSLSGDTNFTNYLPTSFWQAGNINSEGKFVESSSSIITKHKWRTAEYKQYSDRICLRWDKNQTTIEYLPNIKYVFYKKISDEGVTEFKNSKTSDKVEGVTYPIQFIGESGNEESFELISTETVLDGQEVEVPEEATNFSVVIQTKDAPNFYLDDNPNGKKAVFYILCSFAAKNCVVKNCKISHCGRQGITFGLAQFCEIDGCDISDVFGVSPGAGIDIEEGKRGSCHNVIRSCDIKNCTYAIVQAQGHSMLIENCTIDGRLHSEGGMRGNVIRQCTINGDTRISCTGFVDMLKPPVFEQNTVFGSLIAKNAVVKDCSLHGSVWLSEDSSAEKCRMTDVIRFCGRFKDCIWTFDDGITKAVTDFPNINNPELELIGCRIKGKNVYFNCQSIEAKRIEDCEIDVKHIRFKTRLFKNNNVTYNIVDNQQTATVDCPQIVDNTFNCTTDVVGYSTGTNQYRSAVCLSGSAVLVKGNVFNTNGAIPCVYVPKDCFVTFVENEGNTADGTINYDVSNYGSSYTTQIHGIVGANKNLCDFGGVALSALKRFDKNQNEIAYSFKDLENRTKILEYAVDGYKNVTNMLEYTGGEIRPKTDITFPEKILIDTAISGIKNLGNFKGHTELTDVIILDDTSYTILRSSCFASCASLKTFICSDTLQEIWGSSFYGCTSLTEIDLKNVKKIGGQTFYNCTGLKTIYLSKVLNDISDTAFYKCTRLESVVVEKNFATDLNIADSKVLTAESLNALIENLANLTGADSKTLTIGATNVAKLDEKHKTMLTDKNWTLA